MSRAVTRTITFACDQCRGVIDMPRIQSDGPFLPPEGWLAFAFGYTAPQAVSIQFCGRECLHAWIDVAVDRYRPSLKEEGS
jgi:hypothetical protein